MSHQQKLSVITYENNNLGSGAAAGGHHGFGGGSLTLRRFLQVFF